MVTVTLCVTDESMLPVPFCPLMALSSSIAVPTGTFNVSVHVSDPELDVQAGESVLVFTVPVGVEGGVPLTGYT